VFQPNCIFLKDILSELFNLHYNTNNDVIIIRYYIVLYYTGSLYPIVYVIQFTDLINRDLLFHFVHSLFV